MNVGLPTTGLGGIFYILSGLFMPLIEVVYTLRGRSSTKRWKAVLRQVGITTGILALIWCTGIVLKFLFPGDALNLVPAGTGTQYNTNYFKLILVSPILMLGSILSLSWVSSLFLRRKATKQ